MKNKVIGVMSALSVAAPVLAADGDNNATTILNGAQTALSGLIDQAVPIVVTILTAGLVVWGGMRLVRLVMKAFGYGTSR